MQFLCIDASKRDMTQNNTLAFFSSDQTTIPTEVLKKRRYKCISQKGTPNDEVSPALLIGGKD